MAAAAIDTENKLAVRQVQDQPSSSSAPQQQQIQSSPNHSTAPAAPSPAAAPATATVSFRTPDPSANDADPIPITIHIPSYSRWFSWNNIHECEVRFLPEFFDGRSASKNPRVYKYYRNTIIRKFRENPSRKISFTEARKTIIGDVGSIRRVFDFLEAWGLINYSASASKPQLKWEDKDTKSNSASSPAGPATSTADFTVPKKRLCSGCKSVCSIACFACDKYDWTLCARCYVRGNYQVGVNSSDFRRVEISEEVKTDWTDKETLHLLEAIMHYGDDWKKVAEHVGGRSERECVARFIRLPFGEQFVGPPDSAGDDDKYQMKDQKDTDSVSQTFPTSSPSKRMRLTPLADASNPIMAQAAFLSALVGAEVAAAASQAAVRALSEVNNGFGVDNLGSLTGRERQQETVVASNGHITGNMSGAHVEAQLQLQKEELDLERSISGIAEVQMREIQNKIVRFEALELHVEREWQHLQQMKNLLFVDQLSLLFHRTAAPKTAETMEDNVKTE